MVSGLHSVTCNATMTTRATTLERVTNETQIRVALALDTVPGSAQTIHVKTGIGFLDHVRARLSRY